MKDTARGRVPQMDARMDEEGRRLHLVPPVEHGAVRIRQHQVARLHLAPVEAQRIHQKPPAALVHRDTELIADPLMTPQPRRPARSEKHTSELKSLMRSSYAVFCLQR